MRAVGEGGVYRAFLVQAGAAAEQGGGGVGLAVPRRHVQRRPPLLPKRGEKGGVTICRLTNCVRPYHGA